MYQLDLLFEAVGELDDNTQIIIKNGSDIINITNIIHDDPITPITVGDLKQIQKYSKEFGFRWIFNASYMVTSQGYRIFFMPNVIVDLSDIYSRLEKLEKLLVQET
jgi:pimeloyl-CoA synthetase